jgi:hypothetical protein
MPIKHLQVKAATDFFDPGQAKAYLCKLLGVADNMLRLNPGNTNSMRVTFNHRSDHVGKFRDILRSHFGSPDVNGDMVPIRCYALGAGVEIQLVKQGGSCLISFIKKQQGKRA